MKDPIAAQLAAFNQLYKEMDEIYHVYAKEQGISDTVFWILYSLYENNSSYIQKELCSEWHYPPQTVNSALKSLEKQGIISLEAVPGNKKNKLVSLTEHGPTLTQRVIARLTDAERNAILSMTADERRTLLSLTEKYTEFLRRHVRRISDKK
ncbi:MAG: MarR family transcriptional regulator [Lachnospiraceae bacterium]|nr:MarR family transcriptional regulator [Lachnospiraceae bacterium]